MTDEIFTLLFIDDEVDIVNSLKRTFRRGFNVLTAVSGTEGIDIINSQPVDLIISDQRMPDITGDKVLATAKEVQPEAVRILLTGYSDIEAMTNCINEASIYKYLTKPWEPEQLRLTVIRALESLSLSRRLKYKTTELNQAYKDAVTMLSMACEGKDEDTGFHVKRVQHYTEALALELGMDALEAEHMGVMSILHDVGKLFIPDAILQKPSRLDENEWVIMKSHSLNGARILGDNPFYKVAREIAAGHHEHYNGTGYPSGASGEDIPMSARITKVADVFDALSSKRPYKDPWPLDKVIEVMQQGSGSEFDPILIEHFMTLYERGKIEEIMAKYHATDDPGRPALY